MGALHRTDLLHLIMLENVWPLDQPALHTQMVDTIQRGKNLLVVGISGTGKTTVAREAALSADVPLRYLNLSLLEPGDLLGLPKENEHGVTTFSLTTLVPVDGPEVVLLADELDKAERGVQNMMLEVLDSRTICGTPVKIKAVLATANRPDELAHGISLSHAMVGRGKVFRLEASFLRWREWAVESGLVHPAVLAFLVHRDHLFCRLPGERAEDELAVESPRSWTMASENVDDEDHVGGCVGVRAATEFFLHRAFYQQTAEAADELVNFGKHPPASLSTSLDQLLAFTVQVCEQSFPRAFGADTEEELVAARTILANTVPWLRTVNGEILYGALHAVVTPEGIQALVEKRMTSVPGLMALWKKVRAARIPA